MLFGMLKNKSEQEIEIHARAKQREEDEKYWTKRLENQREKFLDELEQQKNSLNKRKILEMNDLKVKFGQEIRKWKNKVIEANDQVRNAQLAYDMYQKEIPKMLDYANTLKSIIFVKQQELTRQLGTVNGSVDGLETLERSLIEFGPKIEKLLGLSKE